MGARYRPKAVSGHVERNYRRLAAVLYDGARRGRGMLEGKVERSHAFRQVVTEAADMADRKASAAAFMARSA